MTFAQNIVDVLQPETADEAAQRLAEHADVAVDVEADAMHAFRARLCFVQVASEADIFLFDTLAPGVRADTLAPLFADATRIKYFHAAGNDLQYLAEANVRVAGLFDTHLAATWLGWPRVGLADLAHQIAGVTLAKEHQQADFSLRPLPPELHAYVADDVRYLCAIGKAVRAACASADILEEVELACRRVAEEALARPETAPLNLKIPGGLRPEQRLLAEAIAAALHRARLGWAEADDVPMGQVLSNAAILDLALRPPRDERELSARRVHRRFARQHGEVALQIVREQIERVRRGELRPPDPRSGEQARRSGAVQRRLAALKAFRKDKAAARGVTPSVVLTNAQVATLAEHPPTSIAELSSLPYFGDKRVALYGNELLKLLGT